MCMADVNLPLSPIPIKYSLIPVAIYFIHSISVI
jgi:hypothetical protein